MLQSAGCHFYESLSVVKGEGRVDGTAEIEYAMIRGAAGDMLIALFGAGAARTQSQSLHLQVRQHRIFWSELGRIAPPRTVHPNIPANAAPEPATPPVIPPPAKIKTTPADTASRMTPSGVPAVIPTPAGPPKKSMPPLSSRGEPLLAPKSFANTKEFQFADRAWFENIKEYRALKADIAKNGLKDKLIEYVEIGGQRYVVRGNGRLQIAEDLGLADQLQFQKVELPFLGYRNEADVIEEALNIVYNRSRGIQ